MQTREAIFPRDDEPIIVTDSEGDRETVHLEFGEPLNRVCVTASRVFFDRLYEALGKGK